MKISIDSPEKHKAFTSSTRQHVLMITNHGIHQWKIIPGLPDTGGQNVFVNQFTEALTRLGFRITIVNRGGYPHPSTNEMHDGLRYKDENQRILYIQDSKKEFVRKEDMHEQIDELVDFLHGFLTSEKTPIDLIFSHYWDAAKIGILLNKKLPKHLTHVWVPHSLGTVKKHNMPESEWEGLRIHERIRVEKEMSHELDGIAPTSSVIRHALKHEYHFNSPLFLPPCVDVNRYSAQTVDQNDPIWKFLSDVSGMPAEKIQKCKIVTEISRTDTTKRKDVLIKAFARARQEVPDSFLVVSIDDKVPLGKELKKLIQKCKLDKHVAAVGSVWDILPTLYRVTDVYCSPSVMEGFGMSVQEAAATKVPVVTSNLVPFVTEYLLGQDPKDIIYEDEREPLRMGHGAIVVPADDIRGFDHALELLLERDDLRKEMGKNAYHITVPYFTWENMVGAFLGEIGVDFDTPGTN